MHSRAGRIWEGRRERVVGRGRESYVISLIGAKEVCEIYAVMGYRGNGNCLWGTTNQMECFMWNINLLFRFDICMFFIVPGGFVTKLSLENGHYLHDHQINGKALFPAAGLVVCAWEALAKTHGKHINEFPVIVSDLSVLSATPLPKTGNSMYKLDA